MILFGIQKISLWRIQIARIVRTGYAFIDCLGYVEDFNMEYNVVNLQVLNEANLTNALLVRAVLTRSDLGSAIIEGADFSDAVLDFAQKQASILSRLFFMLHCNLQQFIRTLIQGTVVQHFEFRFVTFWRYSLQQV